MFRQSCLCFFAYVEHFRRIEGIVPANFISMDETAVWLDSAPIYARGERTINVRTTVHENACVTVCLMTAGDGTKFKPLIIFIIQDGRPRRVVIVWCVPGSGSRLVYKVWLAGPRGHNQVLRSSKKLLVWDSFRCHTTTKTKNTTKQKKIISAIILAGCTGIIQVSDVVLNRPFKQHMVDLYSQWIADHTQQTQPQVVTFARHRADSLYSGLLRLMPNQQ